MRKTKLPRPGSDPPRLVSTAQAAAFLGLSEETFLGLLERDEYRWMRPIRVGRRVLWDVMDVAALAQILARTHGQDPCEQS